METTTSVARLRSIQERHFAACPFYDACVFMRYYLDELADEDARGVPMMTCTIPGDELAGRLQRAASERITVAFEQMEKSLDRNALSYRMSWWSATGAIPPFEGQFSLEPDGPDATCVTVRGAFDLIVEHDGSVETESESARQRAARAAAQSIMRTFRHLFEADHRASLVV